MGAGVPAWEVLLNQKPFVTVLGVPGIEDLEFLAGPVVFGDVGVEVVDVSEWKKLYLSLHSMSVLSCPYFLSLSAAFFHFLLRVCALMALRS